jgi:D-3-phosphoglycerate dehydrogenase
MRILANDGIDSGGKQKLESSGFRVETQKIEQAHLKEGLRNFEVLLVRSATKVTDEIISANPQLKIIGRAGVGLDNIDLSAAEKHGVKVINTPAASSRSVAELAFGHMLNLSRFFAPQ